MIDWNKDVLGFDVETQGEKDEYTLQPWRAPEHAWLSAVAFTRGSTSVGKLYPSTILLSDILQSAVDTDLYVCGWNVTFDCSWLTALGLEDLAFKIKWLDSMLLWRHLYAIPEGENVPRNKRKSYSLEAAVKEFFPDEAGFKDFKNFQTRDPEELKKLLYRCKEDTRFAVRLGELFWKQLTERQQQAALIEARCIPQVAKTNVKGITSNKDMAIVLQKKLKHDGEMYLAELLKDNPELEGVNLGSSKQLGKLLFETWGLPIQGVSKKTGAPSTDKNALYELSFLDPRAKLVRQVREAKNNLTKYAAATIKSLDYNGGGVVRPQARIFGTYTARMTYSGSQKAKEVVEKTTNAKGLHTIERNVELPTGVALHQWKRGKDFRRLIRIPARYTVLELDAAGQEFRWMATASGDETMLSLCRPGEDAHSYMGAQIYDLDYHELIARVQAEEEEAELIRKAGKFSDLSFQYRIGSKKATMKARTDFGMDVTEDQVMLWQKTYKDTFLGVPQYWREQIYKCKGLGYVETFAGRRVQLDKSWIGETKWQMESTAINYRIQGTGADQKYLAMAVARNLLPKYNGYFYFELHDGLFYLFPTSVAQKAGEVFCKAFSNLPYKQAWGVDLPIKFPFDAKLSDTSWGDLKAL